VFDDETYVALPRLFGAPAYTRPPTAMAPSPRPFDPDQLPLELAQARTVSRFAWLLPARIYASVGDPGHQAAWAGGSTSCEIRPRPFSLRAIAGALLGDH
jgi:hypothetical protein